MIASGLIFNSDYKAETQIVTIIHYKYTKHGYIHIIQLYTMCLQNNNGTALGHKVKGGFVLNVVDG